MNRRLFLSALAGFTILPSASTYKRLWRATIVDPFPRVDHLFKPDHVFRFTRGSSPDHWKIETFSGAGLLVHKTEVFIPTAFIPTASSDKWYHWEAIGENQWRMLSVKKDLEIII